MITILLFQDGYYEGLLQTGGSTFPYLSMCQLLKQFFQILEMHQFLALRHLSQIVEQMSILQLRDPIDNKIHIPKAGIARHDPEFHIHQPLLQWLTLLLHDPRRLQIIHCHPITA